MRLGHLVKKEIIELLRQREYLFVMIFMPIIQLVLMGYVLTTDIKNIPVAIVNLAHSRAADQICRRILISPLFSVRRVQHYPEDYLQRLQQSQVKAIILLRDGRPEAKAERPFPEVQLLLDGVDSNTSLIAAGYFQGIVGQFALQDLRRRGIVMPVQTRPVFRFNPELRSVYYMGPGLVVVILTVICMFLTAIAVVREKEQQTMDTLLVSRLSALEIFAGKAIPALIFGVAHMVLGLLIMHWWFAVPLRGNLFNLFAAVLVYLCAIQSYALLISTISSTQQEAMFFTWFSMLTFLLLSGFFTPLENIPPGFRLIADINPIRYMMQIMREIFLRGNGFAFFWREFVILALIGVVVSLFSLANFRRFFFR